MSGRGGARGAKRARGGRAGRQGRGRAVVALGLAAFVLTAVAVVWRRSVGITHARQLRALEARRAELVAQRAALGGAVRLAAARGRVGSVAEERLGMRVPSDTQLVLLARGGGAAGAAPDAAPAPGR